MNSLKSLPLETALFDAWRRIDPHARTGFFVALCISVLAFGFEMTNLTLHHDDVNQIFIEDTILGHYLGRFGVGALHHYIQGHAFMPFLQMAQGMVFMAIYGVITARFWGARRPIDVSLVASIVCVFPYMAQVYQYNTSMASNTLAHMLAAAAVILSTRGRVLAVLGAAALYVGSFSIYQSVVTHAAAIFIVWLLMRQLYPGEAVGSPSRETARASLGALVALLLGGVVYVAIVSQMAIPFDAYQSAEKAFRPGADINPGAALPEIIAGTRSFLFWPEAYFPVALKRAQLVFLGGAALCCLLLPRGWWQRGAALVLLGAACMAPRSLQLLHAAGHFHELSLTAYALVVAATVLIVMKSAPNMLRSMALLLSAAILWGYLLQCNSISTVNALNTSAHFAMTTQVLARVRSLPNADWDGKTIVVVGEYALSSVYPFKRATGVAPDFMRPYHMNLMAKLLRDEATFIEPTPAMQGVGEFAASHPTWPNPSSVGVVEGKGVVVLSKR